MSQIYTEHDLKLVQCMRKRTENKFLYAKSSWNYDRMTYYVITASYHDYQEDEKGSSEIKSPYVIPNGEQNVLKWVMSLEWLVENCEKNPWIAIGCTYACNMRLQTLREILTSYQVFNSPRHALQSFVQAMHLHGMLMCRQYRLAKNQVKHRLEVQFSSAPKKGSQTIKQRWKEGQRSTK